LDNAVVASRRVVCARRVSSRAPSVSQTPCDIPLPCEDGENSSSATAPTPASDAISASLGGSSLQDHQSRLESFGTRALGQSEVFEASLFELRLVKETLNAIQVRSWDPMVEEAAICVGRHSCQNEMSVCSEQSKSHWR
jgi:hypothetical protein